MLEKRWVQWLIVWVAIPLLFEAVGWTVYLQGNTSAGVVIMTIGRLFFEAWLLFGLWAWRDQLWVRRATPAILGTFAFGILMIAGQVWDNPTLTVTACGMYGMAICFYGGVWAIRWLLGRGSGPIFGVALTTIDEAVRMKIAFSMIVLMAILVPVLPFALDPTEMLKYRIQFFLNWSMWITSGFLGLMTAFLACSTICNDLKNKLVYTSMTKPVRRAEYLAGKWLGIMLLNLLLISVSGVAIYTITLAMATQTGVNPMDDLAVKEQILIARQKINPTPPTFTGDDGVERNLVEIEYQKRLDYLRENASMVGMGPGEQLQDELTPKAKSDIRKQVMQKWYSLEPKSPQTYTFVGLQHAKRLHERGLGSETLQLRLKPKAQIGTFDDMVRLVFRINGRPYTPDGQALVKLSSRDVHILNIPVKVVDDEGRLVVQIVSLTHVDDVPDFRMAKDFTTVTFTPGEDMQLLYPVDTFAPNLARSLLLIWIRLGFIAILGLASGAFLGFPVAVLLTMMVYSAAIASGFLTESLSYFGVLPDAETPLWERIMYVPMTIYANLSEGEIWEAMKLVNRLLGELFMWMVPSFTDFDPIPLLTDGLVVPYRMLIDAFLKITLVSTLVVAVVGWGLFRLRELAKVVVS